MTDESSPPPAAEPDTLRGELLDRCTCLIDSALAGSLYSATLLSTALRDYAPGLLPALMERCGHARRRRE